jgi:DNA adenine methylase
VNTHGELMVDSTANARQKRRLDRLAEDGIVRSTVLVHERNHRVMQELKPYLVDPESGSQLLEAVLQIKRAAEPVNVSQVAQLSPLRYPGGKTWLVPEVRAWLRSLERRPRLLVEPFAGGGIVGLTAAAEGLADSVVLAELDPSVAALWTLLVDGSDLEADELFARVLQFEMNEPNVESLLSGYATSLPHRAFATLVKNRVNRGGIMAAGASRMKSGENGKGLLSRWYPLTLVKRMRAIRCLRQRLAFFEGDAFTVIDEHAHRKTAAWFVDPPYTAGGKKAGSRLYAFSEIDHDRLFAEMAAVAGAVMMTYDDAPEVRQLARKHGFAVREVPMKSTHHAIKNELLLLKA